MRSRSHARFTRQRVETACNSADMQGDAFLVTFGRVRPRQLAEIRAAAAPVSSVSVPSEDKQTPELVRTSEGQNSSSDDMAGEWRRSGQGSDRTRPTGRLTRLLAWIHRRIAVDHFRPDLCTRSFGQLGPGMAAWPRASAAACR